MLLVLTTGSLFGATTATADPARWCETSNADFQLISDLPQEGQLELLAALQRFESIAEPFLPGEPVARRDKLKLIVFRQRADFLRLTGKRKFAGYMQPSLQTNRLLIGPIRGDLSETTLHEYAHYLLRNRSGVSLPMWFDEGLATLLGATELNETSALVGSIPSSRMERRISRGADLSPPKQRLLRTLNATELEGWRREQINEFYDLAWLLTHYLYFDFYQEALRQRSIGSSGLADYLMARDQPLPDHLDMRTSQLLRALQNHLERWDRPDPLPTAEPDLSGTRFRCLDPLERDLALALAAHMQNPAESRALLAGHLSGNGDRGPYSVAQTVALKIALARVEIAEGAPEAATQLLDEALALDPGHPEATVLVADLSVRDCLFALDEACLPKWQAAGSLYRQALRQDPNRYDGILGVGLAELYGGRPGDAVNYLKIAYSRAPWAAVVNYYLGESYRLMGDSRAGIYLANARNWAVEDIWRLLAEESLRLAAAARPDTPSDP